MNESEASESRDPLDLLAESFLERFRRGERPSLEEYTAAHPELAEDIRDLFPALVEIERMKSLAGMPQVDCSPSRPPLSRLGDYQIIGVVGHGGMGIVYEAMRESLRRRVALKIMHPRYRDHREYLRRFSVEARAAARLHHTNIVSVFDYGEAEGVVYYAMPFIEGHNLEKILKDVRLLRGKANPADAYHAPPPPALHTLAGRSAVRARANARRAAEAEGSHDTDGGLEGDRTVQMTTGKWLDVTEARIADGDDPDDLPESPFSPPLEEPLNLEPADDIPSPSSLTDHPEDRYHREIARIGAQVADALAYAHRRGVLHRDIKPSNLLLDRTGNVWVTDFGLAKFEDSDDLSHSKDVVGTMRYMAPERFRGISDRKCDLYALGATLYELLALRPAFEAADQLGLVRRIAQEPPVPLREIDRRIPRDLETIVLRALAKEPRDRFGTADEMAAELRRFVENRPIQSRTIPAYERFWRWCKRNPLLASLSVLAATLVVVIAVISSVYASRLKSQRDEANRNLISAYAGHVKASLLSRRVGQRFETLDLIAKAMAVAPSVGGLSEDVRWSRRNEAITAMALPDIRVSRAIDTAAGGLAERTFTADRDFQRYVGKLKDGTVVVRRVADGSELARMKGLLPDQEWTVSLFSPDGRYLAMGSMTSGTLEVWEIATGRAILTANVTLGNSNRSWAFDPKGDRLAVGHAAGSIRFYELPSGRELGRWAKTSDHITALEFNPDGSKLAVIFWSVQHVKIFDTQSGRAAAELKHAHFISNIAWNPKKPDTIAAACDDQLIYVWDVTTEKVQILLKGETYKGIKIVYHPGGDLLVSRGWKSIMRFWDTRTGQEVLWRASPWSPELHFDPGGRRLSADVEPSTARLLEFAEGDVTRILVDNPSNPPSAYSAVAVDRARGLVAASGTSGVTIWEERSGKPLATLPGSAMVHGLLFDTTGALLGSRPGLMRWPIRDGSGDSVVIGPPEIVASTGFGEMMSISADGQTLAIALARMGGLVLDPQRPWRRHFLQARQDVRVVAVSPDGRWVVTNNHNADAGLILWDAHTGAQIHAFPALKGHSNSLANFTPDGRLLIGHDEQGWSSIDIVTWRRKTRLTGPTESRIAISPDSKFAAYSASIGTIDLVDLETGRSLARLEEPDDANPINYSVFSPDGSRLIVQVDGRPYVRIWDLHAIQSRLATLGLDWDTSAIRRLAIKAPEPTARAQDIDRTVHVDLGATDDWVKNSNALETRFLERLERELKTGHPDVAAIQRYRGKALATKKRYAEAIVAINDALQSDGEDGDLLELRGESHLKLGAIDQALADFDAAIRREPNNKALVDRVAMACNNHAWDLLAAPADQRDVSTSLMLANRVRRLVGDRPILLNTLGVALYRAGRVAEAIPLLEKDLKLTKGNADGFDLYFLCMASQSLGHKAEARDYFNRALQWRRERASAIFPEWNPELDGYQAEAIELMKEPLPDFPENVFAPEPPVR